MVIDRKQIYIVDDDEPVCRALSILLGTYGFSVDAFTSATNIEEFFRDIPNYASGCLLLDIHMPGIDGWEILKRIITSRSKMPVIIISADKDGELSERALKAGAVAFLQKPLDDRVLIELINRAFEKNNCMHDNANG